jgi:hypothetical protein
MSEWDDLEYGEDVFFEDLVEYVGPEENRRRVEREISRLMERFVRGSAVDVDWSKALCAQKVKAGDVDKNLWHCPGDTKPSAQAADICFDCPIRLQCLEFACASKERYGIWGGIPENIRAGAGAGHDRDISAYNYDLLSDLPNVYDVESKKFRYHRERLKDWTPGQEYNDENFQKWLISE